MSIRLYLGGWGGGVGGKSEKGVFISLLLVIPQEKENQEKKVRYFGYYKESFTPKLGSPLHA